MRKIKIVLLICFVVILSACSNKPKELDGFEYFSYYDNLEYELQSNGEYEVITNSEENSEGSKYVGDYGVTSSGEIIISERIGSSMETAYIVGTGNPDYHLNSLIYESLKWNIRLMNKDNTEIINEVDIKAIYDANPHFLPSGDQFDVEEKDGRDCISIYSENIISQTNGVVIVRLDFYSLDIFLDNGEYNFRFLGD